MAVATKGSFFESSTNEARERAKGSAHARHPASGRRVMQTYRLKFVEEDERPAKDVEFEAPDSFEALRIAHEEARTRSAELWQDGQKLCSIRRRGGGIWEINPVE